MANRIGRLELLFWCVASILTGSIVLAIVSVVANIPMEPDRTPHWSLALVLITVAVVLLKAQISRFHDIGWSGRAILIMFIPLVNVLAFLFLVVAPGQKNDNSYGEPPVFLQRMRKMINSSGTIVSSTPTNPRNEVSPEERRQRWFEVCLVLLVAFGGSILNSLYLLKNGPGAMAHISGARWSIGIVEEATALLLLGYVLSRRGLRFSSLGFRWSLRGLGVGVLVTGLSYATYALGSTIIQVFHYSIYRSLATGPTANDFFVHPSAVAIPYSLLNPFFEELIVRAYLMTEVLDLTGSSTLAVALSVAVQFSYHLYYGWAGAISLSFLFLVLALYYVRSRSALPVIIAHGFFDVYALLRLW
jgi:membrane protease YdiL (CAAX protease family)